MVNFNAVTIGLEVEFLVEDSISSGIVRYKGPINGKEGDWIGIESLAPGI
jgi:dynactin complex subunit